MTKITPTLFRDRSAIAIENGQLQVMILTGGCHIVCAKLAGHDINPLWEPQWPLIEPNLREIGDTEIYGDHGESKLLSSIAGHNICCDVFGLTSEGEQKASVPCHGEAGVVQWEAVSAAADGKAAVLVMEAHLRHTAMTIRRTFTLGASSRTMRVDETIKNLVGFERALGVAQHATLGRAFLVGTDSPALFAVNADKGTTWPDPHSEYDYAFKVDAEFDYPNIPSRNGPTLDWTTYPRHEPSGDLCALRINPGDAVGWFSAVNPAHGLAVAYAWERATYPWLMTWEENKSRGELPWNNRELTRGMEITSYMMALGRQRNVEIGRKFDTPCFTWLDAYEERTTTFSFALEDLGAGVTAAPEVTTSKDWGISFG